MTDNLVAALARCQAKFPAIVKSHSNPAFKGSQYADVADVLAAVRPVLTAERIVVTQWTSIDVDTGGLVLVTSLLLGEERLDSWFPLHISGLNAQGVGSLMTYHRRYQLCAILGVHPVGDDDDGVLAATSQAQPARQWLPPTIAVSTTGLNPDSYALAAAHPPEKPLAAMTAGEMARYGELIGVRVSGNKSDILRQLEPYVKAAEGTEPFDLESPAETPVSAKPDPHEQPFSPIVAGSATVRTGVNSGLRAEKP